jgi:release factor glutamine methyltransferase
MNYRDIFRENYKNITIDAAERDSEIDFVIEMLTGLKPIDFILGSVLTKNFVKEINQILIMHISEGIPLQYAMGQAFFANNVYFVNKSTLIPRPETEMLVEYCKKNFSKGSSLSILDIGTGSGCIAIELAKYFDNSNITAVDCNEDALFVAKKNAVCHNVNDKIMFIQSDLFKSVLGNFDVIISNPPYIPLSEKSLVQEDVLKFEPDIALFAEENGFFFYKRIIEQSKSFLKKKGLLLFEIGYNQASKISEILNENGYDNILVTQDCSSIDRMISAILK